MAVSLATLVALVDSAESELDSNKIEAIAQSSMTPIEERSNTVRVNRRNVQRERHLSYASLH